MAEQTMKVTKHTQIFVHFPNLFTFLKLNVSYLFAFYLKVQ